MRNISEYLPEYMHVRSVSFSIYTKITPLFDGTEGRPVSGMQTGGGSPTDISSYPFIKVNHEYIYISIQGIPYNSYIKKTDQIVWVLE